MVKCPLCREPIDKDKVNEHIQNHRPFEQKKMSVISLEPLWIFDQE